MTLKFILIMVLQLTALLGMQEPLRDRGNLDALHYQSLVPNQEIHTESPVLPSNSSNSSDSCVKWCVDHSSLEARERVVLALYSELISSSLFLVYVFWGCDPYPSAISKACTFERFSWLNCSFVLGIPEFFAILLPGKYVQSTLQFLIPGEVL